MASEERIEASMLLRILRTCKKQVIPVPEEAVEAFGGVVSEFIHSDNSREKGLAMKLILEAQRLQLSAATTIFNAKHNPNTVEQPTIKLIVGVDEKAMLERIEPKQVENASQERDDDED